MQCSNSYQTNSHSESRFNGIRHIYKIYKRIAVPYQYIVFVLFFLFISCKKEKISLVYTRVETGTDKNIYNIYALNNDTLFACGGETGSGIVLRSTDGGNNWQMLNNSFNQALHSIYFLNALKGFAGADSAIVYKTNDGGFTWESYIDYTGVPYQYRTSLHSVCFTDEQNGFFCGGNNFARGIIYHTHDGGNKWNTLGYEHELRTIRASGKVALAMGYGAVLKSNYFTDFTFTPCDNSYYTGMVFTQGNNGLACSYNGALYKTTDGETFDAIKKPNNSFSLREHYLCIDVRNNKVISCGLSGVTSLSTDGGASFETGYSFNLTRINAVTMLGNNKTIAVGSDGNIFVVKF